MRRIAVVTTGGDAPGMNAAIRGVVRIACSKKFQVLGFRKGWEGLITNTFTPLTPRSVGGILHLGGTILHTSRCPEFEKKEGIEKAAETLASNHIGGLVVIGGDGSFKGAHELSAYTDTMIVGIPASIDNDVFGTEETIGFDTAANTAVGEIDKIRDTAVSQERVFIIEVMGRERGFLALEVGITVGAVVSMIVIRIASSLLFNVSSVSVVVLVAAAAIVLLATTVAGASAAAPVVFLQPSEELHYD